MSESASVLQPIAQMLPGAFFRAHRSETVAAMLRVLDSGWYIAGEEVRSFEEEFARHFEFAAAAGVANGTDAIAIALRALCVGPGDRVATVSHTAVATVAAIEMVGAIPVFVDIVPSTYTMDPDSLVRVLESYKPVKAVIAVHLYGHPANIPEVMRIARQYGASVIEDCAQAHGAKLDGQIVGSFADVATFSFYPTKNLGALGDGGMVVSADPQLIGAVRSLREYGWERRYVSEVPGVNSRLDELQAAVLRMRLGYLEDGNRRRAQIAAAYNDGLADTDLVLPAVSRGATHVYHQYVVRHAERDRLRERLKQSGVGTNIHYPVPVHRQPAYLSRCDADPAGLPITEGIANQILSLPMYPELSDAAVATVIDSVRDSVRDLVQQ